MMRTLTIDARFALGDTVQKKTGGYWRGKVVGFYLTSITPVGYAVESIYEKGSVQIYPEKALERWEVPSP